MEKLDKSNTIEESNIKGNTIQNNIENKNFENHLKEIDKLEQEKDVEDDKDLNVVEKFKIPNNLKKTFCVTIILFVLGAILIGIGFIEEIREDVPGISISMWVLGSIVFIPGGYYAYQFYKAYKANGEDRNDILDQIPEI